MPRLRHQFGCNEIIGRSNDNRNHGNRTGQRFSVPQSGTPGREAIRQNSRLAPHPFELMTEFFRLLEFSQRVNRNFGDSQVQSERTAKTNSQDSCRNDPAPFECGFHQHTRSARHIKIAPLRVLEHQRRNSRFRVHHIPLGQVDTNGFRLQQPEQLLLVGQLRTGWIAE